MTNKETIEELRFVGSSDKWGDLISRSELIKRFLSVCRTEFEIKNKCMTDENVLHIIDNAPTVKVGYLTNCANCERVEKIRAKYRPQGEWKFIQGATTQGSLKCPFCDYRDYHKTNSNYCPNCGADMKGGKE